MTETERLCLWICLYLYPDASMAASVLGMLFKDRAHWHESLACLSYCTNSSAVTIGLTKVAGATGESIPRKACWLISWHNTHTAQLVLFTPSPFCLQPAHKMSTLPIPNSYMAGSW